jgi:DNA-binding FrmR family transcriptional regulator
MPSNPTDAPRAPEGVIAEAAARDVAELAALVRRLRRVEGQVGGLVRMLESGRDCADVVTQLAAASRALDRVGFLLVASELRKCAASPGDVADDAAAAKAAAVEKLFLTLA